MKHLKMLGLAMVALMALMAFSTPASATPVLTSPEGTEFTGEIEATATGSMLLKASVFNVTCTESAIGGNMTINNTGTAAGAIGTLTFGNCGGTTVHVLQKGSLEVDLEGTVKGSGTQVTVQAIGVTCVYGTIADTTLGTFKGGNPAVIYISANLPRISGGFLCANPASWSGQYTITSPKPLLADFEPPVLTSPEGTEYTGAMEATATGSLLLKASVFNVTCTESTVKGSVTTNNSVSAGGAISALSFSNCGGATVDVLAKGSLSINDKGEVVGSGTQVTVQLIGVTCTYGTTTNTPIGTLTPGNPAVIHLIMNAPRIAGGFLCANPAKWEGQYTFTSPKPLLLN